jgi:ketosteroid isomerase-like protein
VDGANDPDECRWVRATVCFRRVRGAWKVVHEHSSVPLYMDGSERAAVDLKPA